MVTKLVESVAIEALAAPADVNGAGISGDWFNLKYYRKITFVLLQGAWAGGTPAVTLEQATSNTGAGAKALEFTKRWSKTALAATSVFAESVVSNNAFNLTTTPNTMTVLEVDAEDLDNNNNYAYVRLVVASPGAFADLLAGFALLADGRYGGAPNTQLPDPKV